MYKVKTQMKRMIVVFFICVGYLFSSGCMPRSMHGVAHPHSDITAPTFCLYDGWFTKQDSKPEPIYLILVTRMNKINDEPFDWGKWEEYRKIRPFGDQVAWEMEYAPDGKSEPPEKPFACITYGKVPPGYIETISALPLSPGRHYTVLIEPKGGGPRSGVVFVIRADSQGRPTHLEYRRGGGEIYIINRE